MEKNWGDTPSVTLKQHLQRYPFVGCKLCTHRCECVGTKNTPFTEEQIFRNLRIGDNNEIEKIHS